MPGWGRPVFRRAVVAAEAAPRSRRAPGVDEKPPGLRLQAGPDAGARGEEAFSPLRSPSRSEPRRRRQLPGDPPRSTPRPAVRTPAAPCAPHPASPAGGRPRRGQPPAATHLARSGNHFSEGRIKEGLGGWVRGWRRGVAGTCPQPARWDRGATRRCGCTSGRRRRRSPETRRPPAGAPYSRCTARRRRRRRRRRPAGPRPEPGGRRVAARVPAGPASSALQSRAQGAPRSAQQLHRPRAVVCSSGGSSKRAGCNPGRGPGDTGSQTRRSPRGLRPAPGRGPVGTG